MLFCYIAASPRTMAANLGPMSARIFAGLTSSAYIAQLNTTISPLDSSRSGTPTA